MKPYPLTFSPILKERIWGGRTLERFGKDLPPNGHIGESWELADLPRSIPDGRSIIANGSWAGRSLHELLRSHPDTILGAAAPAADGGFPLLIKYLDARDNLSIQVHPSEAFAAANPDARLKFEAWVVLYAEPGGAIYSGLRSGVTREQVARAISEGDLVSLLHRQLVQPGDVVVIPSGTVHGLGAGVTVAEVQTPSDTTFRLYDWGRERSSSAREMHIDQALQCIDFDAGPLPLAAVSAPVEVSGLRTQQLAQTPHFALERIDATALARFEVVTSGIAEVWMMIAGSGRIETPDVPIVELRTGRTILMPAALNAAAATVQRGSSILRVTLPSPLKGMIA